MKKRFLSITVVVLLLALICGIARHDNDREEETIAMAEMCLKKIWVASDYTGGYYNGISFCFWEVEDGKCQGGFSPEGICQISECFQTEEGSQIWNTRNIFSGMVRGNTVECRFTDHRGKTGSMTVTFLNENEVEAAISYDKKDIVERKTFRPYHISDIENFIIQEEQASGVELDSWGNVSIAAGVYDRGDTPPALGAYVVNENHDILYEFIPYAVFHMGAKADGIVFWDVNEDGLVDVVIGTCFTDNGMEMKGMPHMNWLFLQSDKGTFEIDSAWVAEEDSIMGDASDAEEGTWEQEYQNCVRNMELRINGYNVNGPPILYRNLPDFDRALRDKHMALWYDSLNMFCKCISTVADCQSENTGSGEEVYRTAVLLMTELRDRRGSSYEPYDFLSSHGEDLEKAREEFRTVIGGENPIDEAMDQFLERFDHVPYATYEILVRMAEVWEKEFYHCLDLVKELAGQSGIEEEEKVLEMLEAYEAFFALWADNEETYSGLESCSGRTGWMAESRVNVFRIGTLLLIDGYEKAGGSYEFLYDSGADRKALTENWMKDLYKQAVMANNFELHGIGNPAENRVPEKLSETLSAALQDDTFESCMAELASEYVLLQEDEVTQYVWEDTSWTLANFYHYYIRGDEEWFLFTDDKDIIVRKETDNEDYPYCYYKFSRDGDEYWMALDAYGKNEDYYFINWENVDYLVVTKRAEGQLQGIAVYNMNDDDVYTGWILGLEKRPDGDIKESYFTYVSQGSGNFGEPFPDY